MSAARMWPRPMGCVPDVVRFAAPEVAREDDDAPTRPTVDARERARERLALLLDATDDLTLAIAMLTYYRRETARAEIAHGPTDARTVARREREAAWEAVTVELYREVPDVA